MEPIGLTEAEEEIFGGIEISVGNFLKDEEVPPLLAGVLRSFKRERGEITKENVQLLEYTINKFLAYVHKTKTSELLISMFSVGSLDITLDDEDEWLWQLSDEKRVEMEFEEKGYE